MYLFYKYTYIYIYCFPLKYPVMIVFSSLIILYFRSVDESWKEHEHIFRYSGLLQNGEHSFVRDCSKFQIFIYFEQVGGNLCVCARVSFCRYVCVRENQGFLLQVFVKHFPCFGRFWPHVPDGLHPLLSLFVHPSSPFYRSPTKCGGIKRHIAVFLLFFFFFSSIRL